MAFAPEAHDTAEIRARYEKMLPVSILVGGRLDLYPQIVLSTYIVECRVSILGITIMIWESIPHTSTWNPLGSYLAEKDFQQPDPPGKDQ